MLVARLAHGICTTDQAHINNYQKARFIDKNV